MPQSPLRTLIVFIAFTVPMASLLAVDNNSGSGPGAVVPWPPDALTDYASMLNELNKKPEFNLTPAQPLRPPPPRGVWGAPGEQRAREPYKPPADGVPRQPGFYKLRFSGQVPMPGGTPPRRISMAYVLYLPPGYDASTDKCPTLI